MPACIPSFLPACILSYLLSLSACIPSYLLSLPFPGCKFLFDPKEGALKPGQTQTLNISFESDILGEFSEQFRFALQGNEHVLSCFIKGHVIGPTFHFDCERVDFGSVSYDYLHSRTVQLMNTSAIPIIFNMHISQDDTQSIKEFEIIPQRGTLLSGTSIRLSV